MCSKLHVALCMQEHRKVATQCAFPRAHVPSWQVQFETLLQLNNKEQKDIQLRYVLNAALALHPQLLLKSPAGEANPTYVWAPVRCSQTNILSSIPYSCARVTTFTTSRILIAIIAYHLR